MADDGEGSKAFLMLPRAAYACLARLEKSDLSVLIVLCSNRDFKSNLVSLGQRFIIDRAGLSDERLVRDSVARLVSLQLIETVRPAAAGRGGRAIWRVNFDGPETPEPVRQSLPDEHGDGMPDPLPRNDSGISEDSRNQSGIISPLPVEMPELMPEQMPEPLRHVSEPITKEEEKKQASSSPSEVRAEKARRNGVVAIRQGHPAIVAIYNAYPRKVGRGVALKAIVVAIRNLERKAPAAADGVAWESWLLERVQAYAAARKRAIDANPRDGPHFTPHAATWFSQQRFDDDPAEWEPQARGHGNGHATAATLPRHRAGQFEQTVTVKAFQRRGSGPNPSGTGQRKPESPDVRDTVPPGDGDRTDDSGPGNA